MISMRRRRRRSSRPRGPDCPGHPQAPGPPPGPPPGPQHRDR